MTHLPSGDSMKSTMLVWTVAAAILFAVCGTPTSAALAFTEESFARGVSHTAVSGYFGHGVALPDLDNDGDPDLVLLGRSDGVVGLYENDGTGNFINRSTGNGIPVLTAASSVIAGDYDDDGDLDLYIGNAHVANSLLRNDGGFSFTDVTVAAGVGDIGAATGCAWGDYDGDGWIDLFVANRTAEGSTVPSALYRNQGDGTFVDVLASVGLGAAADDWSYQAIFFDYDRDADADLYISNDKCEAKNRLFRNDGGTFTDVSVASGTDACIDSMGVATGDFDRNLYQDLYPTNTPSGNPLYLNDPSGVFTDTSAAAGVTSNLTGWCALFLDYDNDGYNELFVCNMFSPNRLYDHNGSWPCSEEAAFLAIDDPFEFTYGGAAGDIDLDGDPDLIVTNSPGPVRMYINQEGTTGHYVKFKVVGESPNRFAIGARVNLLTAGVNQEAEVLAGGNGFKGQNDLLLHFGTGADRFNERVQITWPDGTFREINDMLGDRTWTLYPPSMLGDADLDGDQDLSDAVEFEACYTGTVPWVLLEGCEQMDLDSDGDVDDADFAEFMLRYDGPLHDCNANSVTDLQDIRNGTSLDTGNGIPDECETLGAPSGAIGVTGTMLTVAKEPGGEIGLSWDDSCVPGDGDYGVYEGTLGNFTGHVQRTCSTSGATTATLAPTAGGTYYLVVPNNGAREGSYGDATGGPRPQAAVACLTQEVGACP